MSTMRFRWKPPADGTVPWILAGILSVTLGLQTAYLITAI
jgi:hypothetical protein